MEEDQRDGTRKLQKWVIRLSRFLGTFQKEVGPEQERGGHPKRKMGKKKTERAHPLSL